VQTGFVREAEPGIARLILIRIRSFVGMIRAEVCCSSSRSTSIQQVSKQEEMMGGLLGTLGSSLLSSGATAALGAQGAAQTLAQGESAIQAQTEQSNADNEVNAASTAIKDEESDIKSIIQNTV
jgi:hypothetical protein